MSSNIVSGSQGVLPPEFPVNVFEENFSSGDTVYTVPAGQTFYCTWINFIAAETVSPASYYLLVDGVTVARALFEGAASFMTNPQPIYFIATSGQVITCVHNLGANDGAVNFGGFRQ